MTPTLTCRNTRGKPRPHKGRPQGGPAGDRSPRNRPPVARHAPGEQPNSRSKATTKLETRGYPTARATSATQADGTSSSRAARSMRTRRTKAPSASPVSALNAAQSRDRLVSRSRASASSVRRSPRVPQHVAARRADEPSLLERALRGLRALAFLLPGEGHIDHARHASRERAPVKERPAKERRRPAQKAVERAGHVALAGLPRPLDKLARHTTPRALKSGEPVGQQRHRDRVLHRPGAQQVRPVAAPLSEDGDAPGGAGRARHRAQPQAVPQDRGGRPGGAARPRAGPLAARRRAAPGPDAGGRAGRRRPHGLSRRRPGPAPRARGDAGRAGRPRGALRPTTCATHWPASRSPPSQARHA